MSESVEEAEELLVNCVVAGRVDVGITKVADGFSVERGLKCCSRCGVVNDSSRQGS